MTYKLTINQKPMYLHAIITGWNTIEYLNTAPMDVLLLSCADKLDTR